MPLKSNVSVNPILSQTSYKFMQDSQGFVGRQLFPLFSSGVQAAEYYVFDEENMLRFPTDIRRAPGAPYKRIGMKLSDDQFACKNYGIEVPVDDTERDKYANAFDADRAAANRGATTVLLNHELRVRDLATDAGVVPNSGVGTKWDADGSTPIKDIKDAKEVVRQAIGMKANTVTINRSVFDVLTEHPDIIDRVKHVGLGILTMDLLARLFEVDAILIADGLYEGATENKGVTTITPDDIWGDTVIVSHRSMTQDLQAPNFGRTFAWSQFTGNEGFRVETYRHDEVESDIHRVKQHCDEKLTGAKAGYLLTDVLT